MATGKDLRRLALALEGTTEAPHFDRAAFKVARTYATLAADGKTANFKFTPDEQQLKCMVAPDAFAPVPNAWGQQGWTTATLANLKTDELKAALATAWAHALPQKEAAEEVTYSAACSGACKRSCAEIRRRITFRSRSLSRRQASAQMPTMPSSSSKVSGLTTRPA